MEFVRFMMRDISVSLPLHSSTCCWEGGLLMMELCIWPKCTSSSCAFGVKSRDLRLSIVERKWLWFFSSRLDVISMPFLFHCRDLSATNISMLLNNAFANLHILEELWVNNNVKEPFIFVNNIFGIHLQISCGESIVENWKELILWTHKIEKTGAQQLPFDAHSWGILQTPELFEHFVSI